MPPTACGPNTPRSYRCYYHPRPDAPAESGVLPHIQVRATSAEDAATRAYAVLGKPIDRVERIEPTAEVLAALEVIRTAEAPATSWTAMTPAERHATVAALVGQGRGFEAHLGDLCSRATPEQVQRLASAFPELVAKFGPGTEPYELTQAKLVAFGWTETDVTEAA